MLIASDFFEWKITNWKSLSKKEKSPVFEIGNQEW